MHIAQPPCSSDGCLLLCQCHCPGQRKLSMQTRHIAGQAAARDPCPYTGVAIAAVSSTGPSIARGTCYPTLNTRPLPTAVRCYTQLWLVVCFMLYWCANRRVRTFWWCSVRVFKGIFVRRRFATSSAASAARSNLWHRIVARNMQATTPERPAGQKIRLAILQRTSVAL